MIVQRAWITVENERTNTTPYEYKETKWRGLFLFGLIPLYIWVVEYEYRNTRM